MRYEMSWGMVHDLKYGGADLRIPVSDAFPAPFHISSFTATGASISMEFSVTMQS